MMGCLYNITYLNDICVLGLCFMRCEKLLIEAYFYKHIIHGSNVFLYIYFADCLLIQDTESEERD